MLALDANVTNGQTFQKRQLRPYQISLIEDLRSTIRQGIKKIMVMLPTGAGKTVVAAEIIKMAREKGNKVAFVVPKIDLIDQSIESFWAHGIRDIGALQGNHHLTDYSKPVLVCSVQTLQARKYRPECKIVILDEAHVSYAFVKQWLSDPEWENCIFIGLSATPFTRGLKKYYQTLLKPTSISELISLGYLSNFRVFATGHPNLSGVRTVAGDYVEHELSGAMQNDGLTADIVRTYQEKWNKGKTLCFAVDKAHARHLQERFQKAGINAAYQDGDTTGDDRKNIKKKFHSGEYPVVVNIMTLTTGTDWDVRCLILARPTKSEALFCLDAETEILTSHGWKGMGEIADGDCAAAYNVETGKGCWSRVVGTVERDMELGESWVEYDAPRANFRVTDKHRMLFRPKNETAYQIAEASQLLNIKGSVYMPTAVSIDQPGVPLTDVELYFIGMMMTDGTWNRIAGSISQSERHPEIIERIEGCLRTLGIAYAKRKVPPPDPGFAVAERHPRWQFSISVGRPKPYAKLGRGPTKTKWIWDRFNGERGFGYLMPYLNKDLAPSLMALSKTQFIKLVEGIFDGDGFKLKSENIDWTPRSWTICSARKTAVDRLQALASIHGMTANVRQELGDRTNPIWIITITPKEWRSVGGYASTGKNGGIARGARPQIEMKPATAERVWCIQTEAGTIVTRRRGKVTVMGNCQIIGRALRIAEGKEDALILDHSSTTSNLGFVTEIDIDELDDGKPREKDAKPREERKEPLPKECEGCAYLMPPRSPSCPNCGRSRRPECTVFEADGELHEIVPGTMTKIKAKKKTWSHKEKSEFFSELKAYARDKGYKSGWVARKYRDKFGVWPRSMDDVAAAKFISPSTMNYIRSENIRWAKSKHNPGARA